MKVIAENRKGLKKALDQSESLVDRIEAFRTSKMLTRMDFAESLGISRQRYHNVVSRKQWFAHDILERLAIAYPELDMNLLFRGRRYGLHPAVKKAKSTEGVNDVEHFDTANLIPPGLDVDMIGELDDETPYPGPIRLGKKSARSVLRVDDNSKLVAMFAREADAALAVELWNNHLNIGHSHE